jgi:hypothetical protein
VSGPLTSNNNPRFVERLGHAYLRRLDRLSPVASKDDAIHILNDQERRSLMRIQRFAIFWAALTGVMSALVCAFAWDTTHYFLGEKSSDGFLSNWRHYGLLASIMGIVTVAEIILMYMNALIAVHRLSRGAGIELFDNGHRSKSVATAIVNAALDLPLVKDDTLFVQPGFELVRWKVLLAAIVFKLKVSFSYYLAKFLVQRTFGRVMVRWAVELVAVPIYAFWNAWTTRQVILQARICVMGPSAILQFLDDFKTETNQQSSQDNTKMKQAVALTAGITIARNPQLHPNVWFLSQELWQRFGKPVQTSGYSESFIGLLGTMEPDQQRSAICYLMFSALIDGKLSRTEMELVEHACQRCGLVLSQSALKKLSSQFVHGKGVSVDELQAAFV